MLSCVGKPKTGRKAPSGKEFIIMKTTNVNFEKVYTAKLMTLMADPGFDYTVFNSNNKYKDRRIL